MIKDLTGETFGALTVIRFLRFGGSGIGALYRTRCTCGHLREVAGNKLRNGRVKSCVPCSNERRVRTMRATFAGKSESEKAERIKRQRRTMEEKGEQVTLGNYKSYRAKFTDSDLRLYVETLNGRRGPHNEMDAVRVVLSETRRPCTCQFCTDSELASSVKYQHRDYSWQYTG